MAKYIRCDECGKYYTGGPTQFYENGEPYILLISKRYTRYNSPDCDVTIDLCDSCMSKLNDRISNFSEDKEV